MDSLNVYGDGDDVDGDVGVDAFAPTMVPKLLVAPTSAPAPGAASSAMAPLPAGPLAPPSLALVPLPAGAAPAAAAPAASRTLVGTVEAHSMENTHFERQFHAFCASGKAADPRGGGGTVGALPAPAARAAAAAGGSSAPAVSKRRRERNDDAASEAYLGPWAGFAGEAETLPSALARGELTLAQKMIRLDQGLNPEGPGKLDGEALTAARARLKAEAEAAAAAAAVGASSGGDGGGGGGSGGVRPTAAVAAAAAASAPTAAAASAGDVADGGEGAAAAAASAAAFSEAPAGLASAPAASCKSTFHGTAQVDYQGRSWLAPPKGVRADGGDHECFLPSRVAHRFTGHTKGVQSVEFFPGTGHLLLSASLDGRVKVWDAAGGAGGPKRGVRRTYAGHAAGVRQARFSGDGRFFATASFDRSAKVWDTETGACVVNLNAKGVPHCVTWAPRDDPNVLLAGSGNRKVMQWDLRTPGGGGSGSGGGGSGGGGGAAAAKLVPSSVAATAEPSLLEYDMHYGAVNTVTFFDEGRKFVSTSDDKRLLVWEYGTPVPIKEIQDPSLHAISAAALHPGGGFLLGQSMDNSVVTYAVGDRVGRALKKTFKGHVGSGFACQPVVSADGQFVGSGDGDGTLWFWAWGSTRVLKRIPRAHTDGPAVGLAWHPLLPSSCATSGWDGVIALWE